ncbi:MAG TPA: ComF family protein [Anaerolineae bacterium]|nr:ComF family protein [Anaerolineae bacterium]
MSTQPGRLGDNVKGVSERLLDLLFPPRCVNCQTPGNTLCLRCWNSIERITSPFCARCGHPLRSASARCLDCDAHALTITNIRAVVWHDGAAREAIHALKYHRRRDIAAPLARLLADYIERSNIRFDFITSVPLHTTRQRERGYNQAELLAKQTAVLTRSIYRDTLQRTRATRDQIGLDRAARRANVADAFTLRQQSCFNKNILLIDDVYTTGATLDACAMALLDGGARDVYGLTVAHPRPGLFAPYQNP